MSGYDMPIDDFGFTDPYDAIPFGDAQRFEDNQVALDNEGDDGYDDEGPAVRVDTDEELGRRMQHEHPQG